MDRIVEWLLGFHPGEYAGVESWRFGFHTQADNYLVIGLLVLLAFLVFLTVRSYRREGDAPRGAKIALGILRAVVFLLVVLTIFQPAVLFRRVDIRYSTVVVLVDDSLSMSFSDHYAELPEQREKLAEKLGVDPAELEEMPRIEIVRRMLTKQGGVMAKLAADHPLLIMRFSTDDPGSAEGYTRLVREMDVRDANNPPAPSKAKLPPVETEVTEAMKGFAASGYETQIARAIRNSLEAVQGRRVSAIVLISDGQVTTADSGNDIRGAMAYASKRKVPLYSVLVGDPTPPKNVGISSFQGPRHVRRNSRVELLATLAYRNMDGETVDVKLQERRIDSDEWNDTDVSETVNLGSDDANGTNDKPRGVRQVKLYYQPRELGEYVYRAVVEGQTDERNTEDNTAEMLVRVSDDKIRVLLVSGDSGWEFQYLRNFLLRQPDLYRVSIWQQNADKDLTQAGTEGMKLKQMPRTLRELLGDPDDPKTPGYNVVILYDPEPTRNGFDEKFVQELYSYVTDHGGGLCYIAGNKYSEETLLNTTLASELGTLLPVKLAPLRLDLDTHIGQKRPEPWPVTLTPYGMDHAVTRLSGDTKENENIWSVLPGIFWSHEVHRIKPAARVLAQSSNPTRRTGKNQPEPLIVTQPIGMGRVLYLGFDATWRWRYLDDAYYHNRFWENAIRYLAVLRKRNITISTGGDRFSVGEKITVEAQVLNEEYKPSTEEKFNVTMISVESGEKRSLELDQVKSPDGEPTGRFSKEFRLEKTGTFELTALTDDPKHEEKVAGKRIVVELPQAEARRPEADQGTMQAVAIDPKLNYMTIADIESLVEPGSRRKIPEGRLKPVREEPRTLWDTKLMLLLIVTLLAVEWALRKKFNMA